MPSTSKTQQRLMGQAYALKKGYIDLKDIDPEYRNEIEDISKGMTQRQLKDFASTKHKGLPERIKKTDENTMASPANINGMGSIAFSGDPSSMNQFPTQDVGSGDIPSTSKIKKNKKFSIKMFNEFMNDQINFLKFREYVTESTRSEVSQLLVYTQSRVDHQKISKWLDKSHFYAEEIENGFSFPVAGQDDADSTEEALDKEFAKLGVDVRFVSESLSESDNKVRSRHKSLLNFTNTFNKKIKREELKDLISDTHGDLALINASIATRYLYALADDYLGIGSYDVEFENRSKKPENHFQLTSRLNDNNILWATFIYVDNKHQVILDRCNIEILNDDYETVEVLHKPGTERY